jgi:cytosine/uracil/thiamine/allantoin permease
MKILLVLFTPLLLAVIICAIIGAEWYYYFIGWFSGTGIGTLALYAWFEIRKCDENPTIKIEKKHD